MFFCPHPLARVCVYMHLFVRVCVLTMYPYVSCVKARLNQVNHAVSSLACVCQECLCQARSIWTNQWEKTARRTLGMSDTHLVYKHTHPQPLFVFHSVSLFIYSHSSSHVFFLLYFFICLFLSLFLSWGDYHTLSLFALVKFFMCQIFFLQV